MKKYILLLLVLCMPGSLLCQNYSSAIEKTNYTLKKLVEISGIPGLQATISIGDKTIYEGVFGVIDIETKLPMTTSTKMRIGSVSKLFTAVAVAKMLEENKIAMDDEIRKYVPEFPDKGDPITIRQLLTHSSGIRHYTREETFDLNEKEYDNLTDAINKFKDDSLQFTPGTSTEYSSYGYVLLGAMIEKVSGQDFNSYIFNKIIQPSGILNTEPESQDVTGMASFYYPAKDNGYTFAKGEDNSYKWPAGGYISTSTDLVNFGIALQTGRIVEFETVQLLISPQDSKAEKVKYGMGFRIGKDYKGRTVVHHGGTSQGSRTFFLIYPDEQLTVALNANVLGAPLFEGEAETIAGYFLKDYENIASYNNNETFSTTVNNKEVTARFNIQNSEGEIMEFFSSAIPVIDVVKDGAFTRIISVSRSGILNFWLDEDHKSNFWGYDTKIAELNFK